MKFSWTHVKVVADLMNTSGRSQTFTVEKMDPGSR